MRAPEEINVKTIQFLGEQDGPSEQMLKRKLTVLFSFGGQVSCAYLAQVQFDGRVDTSVALCLRAPADTRRELAKAVGAAFAPLFDSKEFSEIVFLSDEQETQLQAICRPFF